MAILGVQIGEKERLGTMGISIATDRQLSCQDRKSGRSCPQR
jgi:hypothetical protein